MKFEIPTLGTERIVLRPLTSGDAPAVFEWTGDERVAEFMIYPVHRDIEDTKAWIKSLSSLENEYVWGCERKSDGKLIGSCNARFRAEENRWSFGYNFRHYCWGKGYATEVAEFIIKYIYFEHDAHDFVADHAVDNPASGRVLEKCGMKFSGYTEYTKLDGSKTFKAKEYTLKLD